MRKGIIIALVVVVLIAAGALGFLWWRDSQATYSVAKMDVAPALVLREEPPQETGAQISDEMKLLEDLRPLMQVQQQPEPETVFVSEPEAPGGEKVLREKLGNWEYRSFMDFAGERIAVFENPKTNEAIQVREGSELEGLMCRKLTQNSCEFTLGEDSITVSLIAAPEPTPEQPAQPQPPDRKPRPPAPPVPGGAPQGEAVQVVPEEPSDQSVEKQEEAPQPPKEDEVPKEDSEAAEK